MTDKTGKKSVECSGKRVVCNHTITIDAPREKIFPLACPVAEYEWIDGWDCALVYTKSGTNEQGCIFREDIMGPVLFEMPVTTTWVTSIYDSLNCHIRFVITAEDKAVIVYDLEFHEQARSNTLLSLTFSFTSISKEIREMEDEEIKKKIMVVATFLSEALKHYCETGEIMKMNEQ